ncbi:sensor histidine kinase [Paenibacillus tyrfis]|uniref:histidine kinase n=1 Tax=Paenibacillus tyrfis TaxID=1501230 RepID=A0A081NZR0_9BACL|nr:ATP-binding protein [Paenibacillus tyrfis]KEQ23933.1 histidine kinase [Paenibacillus tyrfis]
MPLERISRRVAAFFTIVVFLIVGLIAGERLFFTYGNSPTAVRGELDLRGWDWDRKGYLPLNGEWEFYWNEFKHPADLAADRFGAPSYARLPGSWNGTTKDGKVLTGEGYATYRLKILLSDDERMLALRLPPIYTSYKLWVNGKEIASAGTASRSEPESKPHFLTQLAVAHPHTSELRVVLQVSNYSHEKGGIRQPIEFGLFESVARAKQLSVGFDTLLIGCLLIMGLYHLGLFVVRTKELAMLYFGLFCIVFCLRMALIGEMVVTQAFPRFDWTLALVLEYLTADLSMLLFVLFFASMYPRESSRKITTYFCVVALAYAAVIPLLPAMLFTKWLIVLQLILGTGVCYNLSIIVLAFLRRREGGGLLLFAGLIFAATIVNDMLYAHELVQTTDKMSAFGLLIFIFSQSVLLSVKLSRGYGSEEKLSATLTQLNSGLHDKIKERTADLEEANLELRRKNDELSRMEKSRSRLLSNISHDLGTPLTTIQCYLEAVLDGIVDTEEQKERYLRLIHSKVVSMDRLIEDLFQLSQLEARQVTFKKQLMRTDRLIELLFSRYELDTRNAGIHYMLTLRAEGDDQAREFSAVEVDLERLHQVFSNLIFNAIKFTPEGGSIQVEMIDDGEQLLCRVSDTGGGINEQDLPYVFDRFYTSGRSRNSAAGGKGLGLSISREIIEYHGGRIWVDRTEPGRGTVFCFTIPAANLQKKLDRQQSNCLFSS